MKSDDIRKTALRLSGEFPPQIKWGQIDSLQKFEEKPFFLECLGYLRRNEPEALTRAIKAFGSFPRPQTLGRDGRDQQSLFSASCHYPQAPAYKELCSLWLDQTSREKDFRSSRGMQESDFSFARALKDPYWFTKDNWPPHRPDYPMAGFPGCRARQGHDKENLPIASAFWADNPAALGAILSEPSLFKALSDAEPKSKDFLENSLLFCALRDEAFACARLLLEIPEFRAPLLGKALLASTSAEALHPWALINDGKKFFKEDARRPDGFSAKLLLQLRPSGNHPDDAKSYSFFADVLAKAPSPQREDSWGHWQRLVLRLIELLPPETESSLPVSKKIRSLSVAEALASLMPNDGRSVQLKMDSALLESFFDKAQAQGFLIPWKETASLLRERAGGISDAPFFERLALKESIQTPKAGRLKPKTI